MLSYYPTELKHLSGFIFQFDKNSTDKFLFKNLFHSQFSF